MSFQQGLSGLAAAAKNLDIIGNNVANSNTAGFKQGVAAFGDVFAATAGGGSGTEVGIGTQISAVNQQFGQGNITVTSNPLDVAINGKGFFRLTKNEKQIDPITGAVSNTGVVSYSRAGEFQLDKNGFIVNGKAQNLTGFQAINGGIVPGVLVNLQLSSTDSLPAPSTTAAVGANLASTDPVAPSAAFDPTKPTSYNFSTSSTAFDSLGQAHTMTYYFNKTVSNSWDVNVYLDGAAANGAGLTQLTFSNAGAYLSASNLVKTAALANGAAPLSIALDFSKMTQYGSGFGVNTINSDGYASGQLSGYNIGPDGIIVGRYSNGQAQTLGQIALVNFTNPQGLTPLGGSGWAESSTSGTPLTGAPSTAGLGALQSAAKEDSNVDLTAELVNMITAQRVYQANAQSIKTQDQVLQTLVNLK